MEYFYENPETSLRTAEAALKIPHSTIQRILKKYGMSKVKTKCVPSILTPEQKRQRKMHAKEMLEVLEGKQRREIIVTEDETWINFNYPIEKAWNMEGEEVSIERVNQRFDGKRLC